MIVSDLFLSTLLVWSFHNIVCVVMIRHDPTWLCPRRTSLYINYLGKVYEENEWRKHFRNQSCDVTAQLYYESATDCSVLLTALKDTCDWFVANYDTARKWRVHRKSAVAHRGPGLIDCLLQRANGQHCCYRSGVLNVFGWGPPDMLWPCLWTPTPSTRQYKLTSTVTWIIEKYTKPRYNY